MKEFKIRSLSLFRSLTLCIFSDRERERESKIQIKMPNGNAYAMQITAKMIRLIARLYIRLNDIGSTELHCHFMHNNFIVQLHNFTWSIFN